MKMRSVVVLLAALLSAALTARLGFWQLDRAAQKLALESMIESRSAMPPLPAGALATAPDAAAGQHFRLIRLRGRWMADRTVWLDNRQMDGRPGFFVITPLWLGPGDAVLVQRGWAPRNAADRTRLPPLATPEGWVEVEGRVAPPPARLFQFGPGESGVIRQNLDLASEAGALGVRLRPLSVQQTAQPAGGDDGLLRRWPAPAVDVSKHYGYAFQWFALCALITGLYVWFRIVRPRLRRAEN